MFQSAKIIIVGSGPAGISTAAALIRQRPELQDEILILEKAHHPRHKLCGGGLTPFADEMLDSLGLQVNVPTFRVNRVAFYLKDQPIYFNGPSLMRTIRRNEFDAALVQKIRQRGIRVWEGVTVRNLTVQNRGIQLETSAGTLSCDILVGADGAKSIVRRQLGPGNGHRVSRLMEVVVPVDRFQAPEFLQEMAILDFRPVQNGLQGYLWDFPCWVEGQPHLNMGVFDSRVRPGVRVNLPELLRKRLQDQGIESVKIPLKGHPERWFHPRRMISGPRVLLVGDAAGIEPWLGEGISIALGYGPIAAATICSALDRNEFSFADYVRRLNRSPLGWFLNRNRMIARIFYHPKFRHFLPLFGRILSWHLARKNWQGENKEKVELAVDS